MLTNSYQLAPTSSTSQRPPPSKPESGCYFFSSSSFRLDSCFVFRTRTFSQVRLFHTDTLCFPPPILQYTSFSSPAVPLTRTLSFRSTADSMRGFFSAFNFNPPILFFPCFPPGGCVRGVGGRR